MRIRTHRIDRYAGWVPSLANTDEPPNLVLCFGASSYFDYPRPFEELASSYPDAVIIGCSTSGEIHGRELYDDTLVAAVVSFESTEVVFASVPISSEKSFLAGRHLARDLMSRGPLAGVFVLSEGLDVNGSELTKGLSSLVPQSVPVTGGLAADGDRFEQTWVLIEGKPVSGHATAVGFYGDALRIGHGSMGGWDIFGPERVVTRSDHNTLYELDGMPALRLYKNYLGDLASGLPATGLLFPLSLRGEDDDQHLVRTILAVDDQAESLVFAGDIPQGHRAQLMHASFDRLVDGAEGAAEHALKRGSPGPRLSIAISCVGRRLVLGERSEDELEAAMHILPDGIEQVGFYSYGEISPLTEATCDLHNQTMTLTTIAEE